MKTTTSTASARRRTAAAPATAEDTLVAKAARRRGPAKTGNPVTDRKANAAKTAAKTAPAAASPPAPKLPNGYAVKYLNGAYNLAKKGELAAERGPNWIVICTAHGTTTTAVKAAEGDALGRKAGRITWCKKCAATA